jgi:Protein of unknown function (DUF3040)
LMSLPARQQRVLGRIERSLHASDPRLRSMFATFTKLTRGQRMPRLEQLESQSWLLRSWLQANTTLAEAKDGQRRTVGRHARHHAARDPAGPGHAGGAGICRSPRSGRAQRERLRAGGPAAALRTSTGPSQGLPAGAAAIGVPATATWMTPTPARRPARQGCRGPVAPIAATRILIRARW